MAVVASVVFGWILLLAVTFAVQVTQGVLDELDDPAIRLDVKPWMLNFWKPILRGGWHAPILTIDGRVFSQGVIPQREALWEAIQKVRGGVRKAAGTDIGHYSNAE